MSILNPITKSLVIAGPCSVETEEQLMETARQLAATGLAHIFRAGVWKPRTQPGSFEGVGEKGLQWLVQVKKEYQLPVATEVANAKHVEAVLNAGIGIVWIGARTVTNPFAVQEIADALHGTNTEVLLKNPMVPDLALWIGAIERMQKAGLRSIGAIHRGFSGYQKTTYRNQPLWQIPIELKRRLPEIPLLCDPSHIAGKREYLQEILQRAADLDYNGWMIESHCCPARALSDAEQQVTPQELVVLLNNIVKRAVTSSDSIFSDTLKRLRTQIDFLDEQLLDLLTQRMRVVDAIGEQKKASGITILQTQRRNEMLKNVLEKGKQSGFSSEFIEELFELIHRESIDRQVKIMNGQR